MQRKQQIIIIGDTHFGARNNSMTWLKHQVDGFNEIIEYVDRSMNEFNETIVIHVGDLFDSRSSINPMIYEKVEGLLQKMNHRLQEREVDGVEHNGYMYIIGGNHDYYYQWESENNYSSTLMLPKFPHIKYVNTQFEWIDDIIMIPWFLFHNKQSLSNILDNVRRNRCRYENPNDFIVFTHTDPFHMDPEIKPVISGIKMVTGHIHQPAQDWKNGLLVTGASYPIDFTDTNSERGFWTMVRDYDWVFEGNHVVVKKHGDIELTFHPIKSSIHFHTITEHALNEWQNLGIKKDDYVEVQIRASRVDDYKDVLKVLNENFNTTVLYLTESSDIITEHTEILNVDTVCKKLLPKKLKSVYQEMIDACSKTT